MTSSLRRARGFTLLEVLAAVLILGLFYTVLADGAIRGLRSEGMDRRRIEAAAIADAQLVDLETLLALGAPLQPLREESELGDFAVLLQVVSEDVDALLPPPPEVDETDAESTRFLVDERGDSRVYRLQVVVSWDEAGEVQQVQRTSWDFDRSELSFLFPGEAGAEEQDADSDTLGGGESDRDDRSGSSRSSDQSGERSGSSSRGSGSRSGERDPDICKNVQTVADMVWCLRQP